MRLTHAKAVAEQKEKRNTLSLKPDSEGEQPSNRSDPARLFVSLTGDYGGRRGGFTRETLPIFGRI